MITPCSIDVSSFQDGTYVITAAKTGYQTTSQTVDVVDGACSVPSIHFDLGPTVVAPDAGTSLGIVLPLIGLVIVGFLVLFRRS